MDDATATAGNMMSAASADLLIWIPGLCGLAYSALMWTSVKRVDMSEPPKTKTGLEQPLTAKLSPQESLKRMKEINKIVADGAMSFLFKEYCYMFIYIICFSIFLCCFTEMYTMIAFVVGAVTSIVAGLIGMKIATYTNVRTTYQCWDDLALGYKVAIEGGCVMGLSLVAVGVLDLYALIKLFSKKLPQENQADVKAMYEMIAGYGLGGSSIALFGRVGGGIYTKAADVGADLSGKNDYNLDEDDYRNPGCIADNVGDNVGDIAGMGADLFGSFAESSCAALVLGAAGDLYMYHSSMMYPILISSCGILAGICTVALVNNLYAVDHKEKVETALKLILIVSTVIMTPVTIVLSKNCLPAEFALSGVDHQVQWWQCALAVNLGLWSGLIIGFVTEYYTSHSYRPVREIAQTQIQSAATGIIYGLALGYLSCIIPVFCLGITILISHTYVGMYGIALGALGMLGTMTMGLTIDAYGPISDNAGGIAEMSSLPENVRDITDCLDAAGNTTAAIGKGFAIGSAALVSLALFGAYTVRAEVKSVDILDPWVFTGLLFGAMMPYAFAAWTMKSVGTAANDLLEECLRQFPGIMEHGVAPDYDRCIQIATQASLREMIAPGVLVIGSPLVAGLGFGKNACAGLLSGALVSSVQLAISMSNTGGAWDNAKKYISAGLLLDKNGEAFAKDSECRKNSVTGDTVGDPLKDTSGPALNIVMKLTAIISLVFGTAIKNFSNEQGGPWWL